MNDSLSCAKSGRITYFDTTKGLLMLLLIWGHMIIFAKQLDINTDFTQVIQNTVPFYRAFFMQTFFFITGFCTTWKIKFKPFLFKNLKTILLPAFLFLPFALMTKWILIGSFEISVFPQILSSYIIEGIPWFLAALFLTKIFYWWIANMLKNRKIEWLIIGGGFIIGLIFHEFDFPNNWYYQQALLMLPFMALGRLAIHCNKQGIKIFNFVIEKGSVLSKKVLCLVAIPYFLLIALWQIVGLYLNFPAIDAFISVNYITVVFYLSFALSGTALIIVIAQFLQKYNWINLIGKQSLFVYLIHNFIAISLMKLYSVYYLPSDFWSGAIFYLTIYIFSIILILLGCKLWECKYLSWMLGKF